LIQINPLKLKIKRHGNSSYFGLTELDKDCGMYGVSMAGSFDKHYGESYYEWRWENDRENLINGVNNSDKKQSSEPQKLDSNLDDKVFWEIIEQLDWSKSGNDDAVIKPVIDVLVNMEIDDIYQFEKLLTENLYQLDTKEIAKQIGLGAYQDEDQYFSPDNFLYARCAVVANGEKLFKDVLENPEAFPQAIEFEALLSIASVSYEKKTNQDWDYFDEEFSYETFSNAKGWK